MGYIITLLNTSTANDKQYFENMDFNRIIWRSIGGNPLAIKLLAQNVSIFDFESAALMTLDELFFAVYGSLKPSEQLAWLILALLNGSPTTLNELSQINSPLVNTKDFIALGRLHIAAKVQFDNATIGLTLSACRYIQYQYESNLELQNAFNKFMEHLNWNNDGSPEINLTLIESVLSTDWLYTRSDYRLEAAHQFWNLGILRNHYAKWHSILSQYNREISPNNVDLVIGHGVCQRYLGLWSQAYSTFMSVVQYAGRQGYFLRQAESLLELSILLRYQGDYEGAIEVLDHIGSMTSSSLTTDIQQRHLIERIELAIETNNLQDAKAFLSDLSDKESRKNILQLEMYAKISISVVDMYSAVLLSDKLFLDFGHSASITARIHILMGRIREKNSDIELAIKHLSIALSLLLEQDNDPFALARTQSNLAGVLIGNNRLNEARQLLNSAKYIQRQIEDRVGLAVTMHNEHVVDRKIVN